MPHAPKPFFEDGCFWQDNESRQRLVPRLMAFQDCCGAQFSKRPLKTL